MALNIKDPETDRLARELAAETGEPITAAVRDAIERRLGELRTRRATVAPSGLADVIARGRARPIADQRPESEILGYGPEGLPS